MWSQPNPCALGVERETVQTLEGHSEVSERPRLEPGGCSVHASARHSLAG